MELKQMGFTVIFQKEPEGGYTVFVPLLPGCVSYGKDLDEAKTMIQDAIAGYLQSLRKHHEEIPNEEETFFSQVNIFERDYPYLYA